MSAVVIFGAREMTGANISGGGAIMRSLCRAGYCYINSVRLLAARTSRAHKYRVTRRSSAEEGTRENAGPATWNVLPDHIRTVADPVRFRKLLKSHYFSQAFNVC